MLMLRAPTKSAILYQSFFSETGLENSCEFPSKWAVFFRKFDPENPAKFDFFFRDLPEALDNRKNSSKFLQNSNSLRNLILS